MPDDAAAGRSAPAPLTEDAAWVRVPTPLPADVLRAFCDDVEMLFRINSLLDFEEWRAIAPDRYRLRARNASNARCLDLELAVERRADEVVVTYDGGLKRSTTFAVESTGAGADLLITDDYSGLPEEERQRRLDEVDRSLGQWGHDLQGFLLRRRRWGRSPLWRWYIDRLWRRMNPRARRICFLLIATTAAEFVLFLLVLAILVAERGAG